MKKNLTKKLMLSVLTLAFAVVSLGASTFAWFTMSSTAQIQQFDAEVKAAAGVEIAVTPASVTSLKDDEANALRWYSGVLPEAAIADYCAVNFDALTTSDLDNFYKLNSANIQLVKVNNATEKSYIEFNLWFRTSTADTLCITKIDLGTSGTVNAYPIDAAFKLASGPDAALGDKAEFQVSSAARISLNDNVYEAKEEAGTKTGTQIVAGNSLGTNYKDEGAIDYYVKKYEASYGTSDDSLKDLTIEAKAAVAEDTVSETDYVELVTLAGDTNTPSCVKVKVWVEGWDAECLNAIFSQTLTVDIEFALKSSLED